MVICPGKLYAPQLKRGEHDYFQTSYDRAHYFRNLITRPSPYSGAKKKIRDDLTAREPPDQNYETTCSKTYNTKYPGALPDPYTTPKAPEIAMKDLHEKYFAHPPKPMKQVSTVTGNTYAFQRKTFDPQPISYGLLEDDAIKSGCVNPPPPIPPTEVSMYKHLDPYVSVTCIAHASFNKHQIGGISRNDIITFHNSKVKSSVDPNPRQSSKLHFDVGPYYSPCDKEQRYFFSPKRKIAVPVKGKTSTYRSDYDMSFNLTRLMPLSNMIQFPSVYELSLIDIFKTPAMYCTESCHAGTNWPIRSAVDIGGIPVAT